MKKIFSIAFLVIIIGLGIRFYILGRESQKMNPDIGIVNNKLKSCKVLSRCIVSHDALEPEFIGQKFQVNPIIKVEKVLKSLLFNKVNSSSHYIHYTHSSSVFGFVDDIEFYYLENKGILHFRSSSRVGKSDLGVNRGRIKMILKEIYSK